MCGITGIHGQADAESWSAARRMTAALAHRGPDAEGHWTDDHNVVLGHRRLSILDTSEVANQPMTSYCGRFVIAFNGEVYNYRELREELQDYPFKTTGDTEVVLAALRAWGASALERFNGMFAFALWDTQEEKLLLARDRMGIKPLYLHTSERGLIWASEVRALMASGQVSRTLDRTSLVDFLRYQTVHGPRTLIEGVEMLPAGHLLWADDNEVRTECWWDAATSAKKLADEGAPWTYSASASAHVRTLLTDSVSLRMRSDVPFGAFLSGGIDSSAVVALMSEVGDRKVATFNVAFHEDEFDESQYARQIAQLYDTDHHEIRLSADDFLAAVPDALAATDHPSGDGPNTYVVSQATKKAGLTVALSGLGGDELFAGYPVFRRTVDLIGKQWAMAWPKGLRQLAGTAYKMAKPGISSDKFATLLAGDSLDPASTYPVSRRVLMEQDVQRLSRSTAAPDSVAQWCKSYLNRPPGLDLPVLSRIGLAEMHTYMQHVLLRDTDQMSMAHALEVRVPFLDHRLVEAALAINDPVKFPHTPKSLLTAALGDRLPRSIIDRPKMGFTLPWDIWMRGPLEDTCKKGLDTLIQRGILDEAALNGLWRGFETGNVTWSRVWTLVALGQWIERHDLH